MHHQLPVRVLWNTGLAGHNIKVNTKEKTVRSLIGPYKTKTRHLDQRDLAYVSGKEMKTQCYERHN